MTSHLDLVPTVLDWFGIDYPRYKIFRHDRPVQLTGKSLLPVLTEEPGVDWDYVYASHSLHEITMYYPIRAVRNSRFKLIHNLNYRMPFPIDQDFYFSSTFLDILNRTAHRKPTKWFTTIERYYYRDQWELYDLVQDPNELHNVINRQKYASVLVDLKKRLKDWQNQTFDPWICSPGGVLDDKGRHLGNPQCSPLLNGLSWDLICLWSSEFISVWD